MKFSIGADPELFLSEKGSFKSAARILEGTKFNKETLPSGAGLHYDNVACEFSTTVSGTEDSFEKSIRNPLGEIKDKVGSLEITRNSHAIFPDDQVTEPEEQEFGCEPDYDAWELVENCVPIPPTETFRSCGGHVHVGYTDGGPEELQEPYGKVAVVKLLDLFLGIPFVILDRGSDTRRKLYGKAGCHRPTEYGVEYRVLSNFWIFSEDTTRLVYKCVRDALRYIKETDFLVELGGGKDKIVSCINESNVELAKYIFNKVIFPRMAEDTRDLFGKCWRNLNKKK